MNIAILTFEGFNEIDSFVSHHILTRVNIEDWKVAIACPSETVTSTGGIRISAQQPLEFANEPMRFCSAAVRAAATSSRTARSCRG